jgi:hypothetical protein
MQNVLARTLYKLDDRRFVVPRRVGCVTGQDNPSIAVTDWLTVVFSLAGIL